MTEYSLQKDVYKLIEKLDEEINDLSLQLFNNKNPKESKILQDKISNLVGFKTSLERIKSVYNV